MNPQGISPSGRTSVGSYPTPSRDLSTGQDQNNGIGIGIGIGNTSQKTKTKADKLESIGSIIASQLPVLQASIEKLALSMLDLTNKVRARKSTLAKFNQVDDNGRPFIPQSARVNITLNSTTALANDAGMTRLKGEVCQTIELFETSMAKHFKEMAEMELKHSINSRVQDFVKQVQDLTDNLIDYHERVSRKLTTTLGHTDLVVWFIILYIRHLRTKLELEETFLKGYLKVDYKTLLDKVLTSATPEEKNHLRARLLTSEERTFFNTILKTLLELIVPITYELQQTNDKIDKERAAQSFLEAKMKRKAIISATEATAIALQDTNKTTTVESNMEKLIESEIRDALKNEQNDRKEPNKEKKRKNSQGGRQAQSTKPDKTKGQKSRSNKNDTQPVSILKKKVRFQPNKKDPHNKNAQNKSTQGKSNNGNTQQANSHNKKRKGRPEEKNSGEKQGNKMRRGG